MAIEVFNRREIKYLISQAQFEKMFQEAKKHMNSDRFNLDDRTYSIHNVYFDTDNDFFIRTSLEKPVYKHKIRLRSYGKVADNGSVFLEIKKKYKGIVNKRRASVYLNSVTEYVEKGITPADKNLNRQVFNEIDYIFKTYPGLRPKVFISYDRFAFFEKGNKDFRLTFDTNIRTRRKDLRLDIDSYGNLLLDEGCWIMEAKAFNAFPLWFAKCLSENNIYSTSFSKYGKEYLKMIGTD